MNKIVLAGTILLIVILGVFFLYTSSNHPNTSTVTSTSTTKILNLTQQNMTSVIKVGVRPDSIVSAPNGTYIYVANYYSNNISIINTAQNKVIGSINTCINPYSLGITNNGKYLFVYCNAAVSILNLSSGKLFKNVSGNDGKGIYFANPGPGAIFDILNSTSILSIINTTTGKLLYSVNMSTYTRLSRNIFTVALNGKYVYDVNFNNNYLFVINSTTNTLTTAIPLSVASEYNLSAPTYVEVNPNGGYVYVGDYYGSVDVINTTTNKRVSIIPVGYKTIAVTSWPNGKYLYVISDYNMSIINLTTNKIRNYIMFNTTPFQVAPTPGNNYAYVLSHYGPAYTIYVFDANRNKVLAIVHNAPAITPDGRYIYVINPDQNTVIVMPQTG